jgi:RNA polymerase II subunit A small phosphatase-like protein
MSMIYEIVCFTASVAAYAAPLMSLLDPSHLVRYTLFRDHCVTFNGILVKDLSRLGRPLNQICLVDNNITCGLFQPQNTIGIGSWFDDEFDEDLIGITPLLVRLASADSVEEFLSSLSFLHHNFLSRPSFSLFLFQPN